MVTSRRIDDHRGKTMKNFLEELIIQVKAAYGKNLRSLILYGSRAAEQENASHSDYNVLIVLDAVTGSDITALHPFLGLWMRKGNPVPLIFSYEEFLRSADVFPIDYLDM
jgi:hypothetical protein